MKKRMIAKKTAISIVWGAREYNKVGGAQTAAALSYFLILTIFPLLLCLHFFLGLFQGSLSEFVQDIQIILPHSAVGIVEDYLLYIAQTSEPALLVIALGALIMSASAAVRTQLTLFDRLFDRQLTQGPGRTIVSIVLSVVFLLSLYLSVAVIFTGEWFYHFLRQWLWEIVQLPTQIPLIWGLLRYLLLFFLMLILVLAVFTIGTQFQHKHRKKVRLCALLTAAATVAGSGIFSGLINFSTRYSLLYGSIASMMIMLVWLYFCGNIMVIGSIVLAGWIKKRPSDV